MDILGYACDDWADFNLGVFDLLFAGKQMMIGYVQIRCGQSFRNIFLIISGIIIVKNEGGSVWGEEGPYYPPAYLVIINEV